MSALWDSSRRRTRSRKRGTRSVMDSLRHVQRQIDNDLAQVSWLENFERFTGYKRSTLATVVSTLAFLAICVGFLDSLLTNLIGFAYPAYASFKAIEAADSRSDTQWLTYWVVFATFTVLEYFSQTLLYYFPLYYPFKVVFLVWLLLPHTQGAVWLYHNFVRTFLVTHETTIDSTLQTAVDNIKEVAQGETAVAITKRVRDFIDQVQPALAKKEN